MSTATERSAGAHSALVAPARVTAPRNRTDKGEARRREIMTCGVRLVAERGVLGVKVVDIARALDIPSSLFYWYFRDLDDLLTQAITDSRRYIRHLIATLITPVDDLLARIYITVYAPMRVAQVNETERVFTLGDVEVSLHPRYVAELHRSLEGFIAEMTDILVDGQRNGDVRADVAARHLALCLQSLVQHNLVLYYRGIQPGSLTRLAETIASVAVRGICTDLDRAAIVEQTWSTRLRNTRLATRLEILTEGVFT